MNFGEIINEAESLVKQHPDQAKAGLDKAEELLDQQTGGQHTDQIKQGMSFLEGKLGLDGQAPAQQ